MVKARFVIAAASAAAVAAGLLTAGILAAAPAGAAVVCSSEPDCYSLAGPPAAVAGASQDFVITVTNGNSRDTLGSVKVNAPSNFVITSASVAGGPSATASVSSASVALFQDLGLHSGGIATLTVVATVPCAGAGSAWTIQPGEASLFGTNGDNDNDAAADFQASSPPAAVTGTCSLAFQNEPNQTLVGAQITNEAGSLGSPVSVEVLDGNGNLITSSTAPITVAIGANPGSGTLSGTTTTGTDTVSATGGVASFPGLSINKAGTGYTLVATTTSAGITPATSSDFDIWSVLKGCSGGSCAGSYSSSTTTGAVTTSSASAGQFLGVGLGGVTLGCGSYQPLSDPLSFDVLSASGTASSSALFSTTLELAKSVVQSSNHPGASSWQICYASQQPFTAQAGTGGTTTIGGVTYFTGLLPDCNNTQTNAPCVQSRNKTNAGVEVVTFLALGDPVARM